jgi:hypothetical protein
MPSSRARSTVPAKKLPRRGILVTQTSVHSPETFLCVQVRMNPPGDEHQNPIAAFLRTLALVFNRTSAVIVSLYCSSKTEFSKDAYSVCTSRIYDSYSKIVHPTPFTSSQCLQRYITLPVRKEQCRNVIRLSCGSAGWVQSARRED